MGIFSKLRSLLGKKKPKAPTTKKRRDLSKYHAHRGQKWISKKMREKQAAATGKFPFTAAETAQWEELTTEETEAFLYDEVPLRVHSSNVQQFQYFPESHQMKVWYHGKKGGYGGIYIYEQVSEDEAHSIAYAGSKGIAVWDLFRVRGSKWGHKKPYRRVH
jgi:hypothetical protein